VWLKLGWSEIRRLGNNSVKSIKPTNWYLLLCKEIIIDNRYTIRHRYRPSRRNMVSNIEEEMTSNRRLIRNADNCFIAYYCHVTNMVYLGKKGKENSNGFIKFTHYLMIHEQCTTTRICVEKCTRCYLATDDFSITCTLLIHIDRLKFIHENTKR
jgi:hypothetical protein